MPHKVLFYGTQLIVYTQGRASRVVPCRSSDHSSAFRERTRARMQLCLPWSSAACGCSIPMPPGACQCVTEQGYSRALGRRYPRRSTPATHLAFD